MIDVYPPGFTGAAWVLETIFIMNVVGWCLAVIICALFLVAVAVASLILEES